MCISDWSSDVCSSDLKGTPRRAHLMQSKPLQDLLIHQSPLHTQRPSPIPHHLRHSISASIPIRFPRVRTLHPPPTLLLATTQIGRASCRERLCQYVSISVGAV